MISVDDTFFSVVDLISALCATEVGITESKLILCIKSNVRLPDKLGELLSSMYLLGALKVLTEQCIFWNS